MFMLQQEEAWTQTMLAVPSSGLRSVKGPSHLDSTQLWFAVRPRAQKQIPSFQDHLHHNRSDTVQSNLFKTSYSTNII